MTKPAKEIDRSTHAYKKSTIINKNSDKPKADKSRHYVDGVAFYEALKQRKKDIAEAAAAGKERPRVSNFIGECVMNIAKNLSRKYQFANYPFRDEMVADAIVHCIRYIDSFDPEKSTNPFSYYTQTCYYQFLDRIRQERTHTYIKCKATLNSVVLSELSEFDESNSEIAEHIHDNFEFDNDFMEKYVNDFESKMVKARGRVKKRGLELLEEDADDGISDEVPLPNEEDE